MTDLTHFGDPAKFEIAAKWSADMEPRDCLPADGGWSTGELRITVGGQVLTEHRMRGTRQSELSWYLAPLMNWLVRNWTPMFHEESFTWRDRYGLPAAVAIQPAIERTLGASDAEGRAQYDQVHAWRARHALRTADSSGLYPDLYIRRSADDVELSWGARQPAHAPAGFSFVLAPGYALLGVHAVAQPLWQFLTWALKSAPVHTEVDTASVARLQEHFDAVAKTPLRAFEQAYLGERLLTLVDEARAGVGDGLRARDFPAIESFDSAVLMFGGLEVDLGAPDVQRLLKFLASVEGGQEAPALTRLVRQSSSEEWLAPHEEGYRLAEECRDELGIPPQQLLVDVERILKDELGVAISDEALETPSIRGVAVAGATHAPAILINSTSAFNAKPEGRRFTLAHEFCHLIYDRTRARKLSHLSGQWAASRVEKRANAFAAMFLAPPSAIRGRLVMHDAASVGRLASQLGLGFTALVEHLYNLDLIDEVQREDLRRS